MMVQKSFPECEVGQGSFVLKMLPKDRLNSTDVTAKAVFRSLFIMTSFTIPLSKQKNALPHCISVNSSRGLETVCPQSCVHHDASTCTHTASARTHARAHLHVDIPCFPACVCMCSPRLCWRLTMPPSVHLRSSRFRWALRRLVTDMDG